MTTLLYAKDYIKTKINSEEINLYVENIHFLLFQYDEDNPTTDEEIL